MKRFIITTILLVCFNQFSVAQIADNTEASDSTNIYYQSLKQYCDYLDSLNIKYDQLYIEENSLVTDGLPDKVGKFNIAYLNITQLKELTKGKEGIQLIRIVPLRVKKNEFFVNIIPFKVTYKKNNFNFVNSGGESVVYTYDDEIGKFIFKEIRHGRI